MTTRKEFLGASALIAAALPSAAEACAVTPPPGAFSLSAFASVLSRKVPHKNLFSIRKVESGTGIDAMESTYGAHHDLGVASHDLLFAAVLYHGTSIAYAFDDVIWDQYIRALLQKHAEKLSANEQDLQTIFADTKAGNPIKSRIAALATTCNARFFVCNNALKGWTKYIAEQLSQEPGDVYANFNQQLLPNASIVPAGVWAVHAIQERGFTLLHTT